MNDNDKLPLSKMVEVGCDRLKMEMRPVLGAALVGFALWMVIAWVIFEVLL